MLLPSFGFEPAFSRYELTLDHWLALGSQPEFWSGLWLSGSSGIIATLLSYWFASSLLVLCYHRSWFQRFQSAITPILSIPHAAITIGLLFLLSPSGWLIRFISPWLSGWDRPPNLLTTQDPYGITLILALVVKEMPYLLFALLAAISQLNPNAHITTARVLGYDRTSAWHFVVLPRLYELIRLPIFIVLAFNLTVVDVASIIGPNTPSTLAVTLLRWFNDPSLSMRGLASAAAIALTMVVLGVMIGWHLAAKTLISYRHYEALRGDRKTPFRWLTTVGAIGAACTIVMTALTLLILPLWAFAKRWRFPDTFPSTWTFDNISRASRSLIELSTQSLTLAFTSTTIALVLSLILLEKERHTDLSRSHTQRLLYIPIILPQVTLLFGVQVSLLWLNLNGTWYSVAALHTFYSLPYVYLTLKSPYLAYDQAYLDQANRLKPLKWRNFFMIKLAMLKAPLFATFAIGFSVSMAQYLPTLMAGEGRITTLTTEAVTRAASGDRKLVSIMALMQAIMPLCIFALAMLLPRYWTPIRLTIRKRMC
ncbi:ABC transporter permease [Marinomonas piezotolerans]|uniref:ABC transporter permease n=1 Tax=Marinomonas piezotolerans TaxID=2213058 RepID=UPI001FE3FD59|nr:ABC transporter permease [Marinomonas piezotolerans]